MHRGLLHPSMTSPPSSNFLQVPQSDSHRHKPVRSSSTGNALRAFTSFKEQISSTWSKNSSKKKSKKKVSQSSAYEKKVGLQGSAVSGGLPSASYDGSSPRSSVPTGPSPSSLSMKSSTVGGSVSSSCHQPESKANRLRKSFKRSTKRKPRGGNNNVQNDTVGCKIGEYGEGRRSDSSFCCSESATPTPTAFRGANANATLHMTSNLSNNTSYSPSPDYNINNPRLSVCADSNKVDPSKMAQTEFQIIEFDSDTFRNLLTYLHTGSCQISCLTIPGLICAAEHYDLPELLQACFHHVKQFIRVRVCCKMLMFLENYCWRYTSASELVNMIVAYIESRVEAIFKQSDFICLSESMVQLIMSQNLCVSELTKFNAMLEWAQHSVKSKNLKNQVDARIEFRCCMDRLTRDLKLYKIPPHDLISTVLPSNALRSEKILETLTFQANTGIFRVEDNHLQACEQNIDSKFNTKTSTSQSQSQSTMIDSPNLENISTKRAQQDSIDNQPTNSNIGQQNLRSSDNLTIVNTTTTRKLGSTISKSLWESFDYALKIE